MTLLFALLLGLDTPPEAGDQGKKPTPSLFNPGFTRPAGQQDLHPLMMAGLEMLRRNQPKEALDNFMAAHRSDPENPRYQSLVGIGHLHLNECAEGQEWLMPIRAIRNFRSASADKLAACWARQGAFGEAVFWQEESIWLEPDRAVSWSLLALYLLRLGDHENMERALAEAEFMDDQVLRTDMVQAMARLSEGDIDGLEENLRELRSQPTPGPLIADQLEARLELDLGNHAEAMRLAVLAQQGPERMGGLTVQAEACRRAGNLDEAWWLLSQRDFSKLPVPDVHVILVRVLTDRGDYAAAAELSSTLFEGDPWNADVVASAWYLAQAKGRRAEADRLAERFELVNTSPLRDLEGLLPPG